MSVDSRLEMTSGCPVFLELDGSQDKLKSRIVGFEQQKYVIISAPQSGGSTTKSLPNGAAVVLKTVIDGVVIAFQTPVMETIKTPDELVFLSYPREITRQNLRQRKRYDCSFKGEFEWNGHSLNAEIVDISLGGCCCSFASSDISNYRMSLEKGSKATLTIRHTQDNILVQMGVMVTNFWDIGNKTKMGISWQSLTSDQERHIKDLIFSLLAK